MADMLHAKRKSLLEDFHGGSPFVSLKPAASASRLSLRARESAVPALSEALG
ncbi:MAG: sarcosine oxidase subunit gamma, partial [Rhizobium oryzihabitans]